MPHYLVLQASLVPDKTSENHITTNICWTKVISALVRDSNPDHFGDRLQKLESTRACPHNSTRKLSKPIAEVYSDNHAI